MGIGGHRMSEVEKMYVLAKVKNKYCCKSSQCIVTNPYPEWCNKCESLIIKYPDFTAEKQLELIKWLVEYDEFSCYQNKATKNYTIYDGAKVCMNITFEECIASWITYIWKSLTETERNEIRDILRG